MAHHGDDDKPRIPRWNGDPSRFQHWNDEVRIYKLGENLKVNCSVAARPVGGLSGPARKVCLSMTDEDLFPYATVYPAPVPPAAGQPAGDVPVPPDGPGKVDYTPVNRLGIENFVGRLQNNIVTQAPILKGERMTKFFEQHEYFRRGGERVSEYIIRWDESVERLEEAGVHVMRMEGIPGPRSCLRGAGLDLDRRERVLGQLKDDHYPIEDIKNICIRFLPDVHTNEPSAPASSYGHNRTRQALITTPVPVAPAEPPQPQHQGAEEHPEAPEDWSEWPEEEEAAEVNISDFQNVRQDELNGLAGDLEASGDGVAEYVLGPHHCRGS